MCLPQVARVLAYLVREEGQSLTEYALILALVSVVAIAALQWFGRRHRLGVQLDG